MFREKILPIQKINMKKILDIIHLVAYYSYQLLIEISLLRNLLHTYYICLYTFPQFVQLKLSIYYVESMKQSYRSQRYIISKMMDALKKSKQNIIFFPYFRSIIYVKRSKNLYVIRSFLGNIIQNYTKQTLFLVIQNNRY